ncbi:hypothetical protein CK203_098504 [Vitis vinifera]|uniref:Uncharacterized protein n=1 Tax=Vitis vinifera TaxID=29760 RepID=A0A438D144_VITVI|nr:hypothetical protein CK203_098504 [Vitis vinifera]
MRSSAFPFKNLDQVSSIYKQGIMAQKWQDDDCPPSIQSFFAPLADAEGAKKHSMIELLKSYGGLSYCILPHYFEILRNAGGFSVKCNPEAYLQIVYDLLILESIVTSNVEWKKIKWEFINSVPPIRWNLSFV